MKDGIGLPHILIVAAIVIFGPSLCNNSGNNKTDGIFESATRKIDAGRADELTEAEKQRLSDVMNWCNVCNKPLRSCKHGK